jgi:hypothetical protein
VDKGVANLEVREVITIKMMEEEMREEERGWDDGCDCETLRRLLGDIGVYLAAHMSRR